MITYKSHRHGLLLQIFSLAIITCLQFNSSNSFTIDPLRTTHISKKQSIIKSTRPTLLKSSSNDVDKDTITTSTPASTLQIVLFGIGDLRTIDHGGLFNAIKNSNDDSSSSSTILPLVILDTKDTLSNMPMGRTHAFDNASILHSSLVSLQSNLKTKYGLDLHVCMDSNDNSSSAGKKGVVECLQNVIEQYTKENSQSSTSLDKIIIHSCDLGDVDNHLGYGPYGHLTEPQTINDANIATMMEIEIQGWDCQLRTKPWDDLSTKNINDFPSTYTDYEKIFIRNDKNNNVVNPLSSSSSSSLGESNVVGVTIPSMTEIPSMNDICGLLCTSLDMNPDDVQLTCNTGLYATHWGGLQTSSTLDEQTIVDVIDTFLGCDYEDDRGDQALANKFKWWNINSEKECQLKRNPQSLEHASMNWLMTGGIEKSISNTSSSRVKTENLIESELLTRYLAAPLLFGMVSSRYIWNAAEQIRQKNESPFDFFAAYRSSVNAMQSIVESREWHNLFAAKNLRMTNTKDEVDFDSVKYEYLRWHGFLCRYGIKTINTSKSSTVDEKEGIVLVHGFGASGSQWEKAIHELENSIDDKTNDRSIEAFAPDLMGFGQSQKPSLTYTQYLWEGYTADCVKEVGLGQRQWSKFAIGGNSIGGYTAMGAAADDTRSIDTTVSALGSTGSGKCQGLVLMNSAGRILTEEDINESEKTIAEVTVKDMLGLSR